ncbi:hypothetical protein CgunFtcFv8_027176 [Champsocephalus gunnari]|uniref:Ig-like domain-containing protein n=1 Tax=Champsocephalus gunnari TaxID=52237 RepID=A0AAN8I1T4_CHAGU|nr:hypothetical protein CgunFtcFv8_027176 [Champsocephalus gunnari]
MLELNKVALLLSVLASAALGQGPLRTRSPSDRSRRASLNTFTDTQTTGVTEWTSWFNIDHPGGNGDYERLEAIRFYYRERVCVRPVAMEARTTDWVAAAETGEVVHSSLEKGFWCINREQPQGRVCSNYHVRFQCHPVQSYWTDWTCQGHHSERRECSNPPCSAKWSPWGRWGMCSVTCGGGRRIRRRTCARSSVTVQCSGRPAEIQKCGRSPCPAKCQLRCTEGSPSEDCSRCSCDNHILQGEVHSVTGAPVAEALVALASKPAVTLARTDANGQFRVTGICSSSSTLMSIRKDKFAPITVSTSSNTTGLSSVRAVLKSAEKPYIVKHPEDKVRYEGGRVMLCCKATGSPAPDKYYWFHNGTLLDRKVYKAAGQGPESQSQLYNQEESVHANTATPIDVSRSSVKTHDKDDIKSRMSKLPGCS